MAEVESQESKQGSKESNHSPGELLAQAREDKGLSRVQISELLGLTTAVIRDIELNRFERFPSGIYARGYVRNYCKLVEADEIEILAAYDHYGETHEVPEEAPFGSALPASPTAKPRWPIFAAVAVVVIGIGALLLLT